MFDPMYDQAAGLRSVVAQVGIKLVPVVLSRDADTAFDLVWMLGAGLSTLGRTVVALDATSREQPGRPGLAQQLHAKVPAGHSGSSNPWYIMPSQSGLSTLMHTAQTLGAKAAQARLVALFAPETVVLVLAPKEWLSVLFEESDARPLVPFTLAPSGVVDAYSAIKVLHQAGGLKPVLVPVKSDVPDALSTQGLTVLADTARAHLGWTPESWPLPMVRPGDSRDTLSQWMLRIEESALALDDGCVRQPAWTSSDQPEALVPQLWSC
ncbi:MAG: hypothetical protein K2W33_12150 [Burkholderiales bacterium]|nr:hypothetical protein [Burkholderiales bacterium]